MKPLCSKVYVITNTSGKMRLEQSELAYGLPQTLKSHGNGGKPEEKEDNILQTDYFPIKIGHKPQACGQSYTLRTCTSAQ